MILRTRNVISLPRQEVRVNGSVDSRFYCTSIRVGSYSGMTEAEFMVPEFLADSVTDTLRDAFVSVRLAGSGEVLFNGYIAVDAGSLSPSDDSVVLRGYSITRWLSRCHVGQASTQWEVPYYVKNPTNGELTGWTPALILMHLWAQLPESITDRLKLGDIKVLHDLSSLSTPDITFRLTDYASAINQLASYVGDVGYRERFQGDVTYLDFYRINAPSQDKVSLRHASWTDASRANVQSSHSTNDSTNLVDRVIGFGAYRQFMITSRNYLATLPSLSEPDPNVQLQPFWDTNLEQIILKAPSAASGISAMCIESRDAMATTISIDIPIGFIPPGAEVVTRAGETMIVVSFHPAVGELVPYITVTRAQNGTVAGPIQENETLQIRIPGIEHVFRRYLLPRALWNSTILGQGCLTYSDGSQYPQIHAFMYPAREIRRPNDGAGNVWVEGVLPITVTDAVPLVVSASLDPNRRIVTFNQPVIAVKSKKQVMQDDRLVWETTYQRTVCGVTVTVENQAYPFYHDTGAQPVTSFDFNTEGFTERWQKNEFAYWQLGTGPQMPINGVLFPCIYFQGDNNESAFYVPTDTQVVARTDYAALRTICEQTLREKNRRARSWSVTIPWVSPGFKVGQQAEILGLRNFPADIYKITSVEHRMETTGAHQTVLQIDNIKPPVRHRVRGGR